MEQLLSEILPIQAVLPGVYMSGQGMNGETNEGLKIFFAGAIGALLGFVVGVMAGTFARIITMNRVKGMIGGMHWGAYGTAVGAVTLALLRWLA